MSSKHIAITESIEAYIEAVSGREPPVLARLRQETATMPAAMMQITPLQGQFMQVLLQAIGARRIVEIGVFTGYSSLAMALALPPDGHLTALDISEEYTAVARRYWQEAGVADRIDLRLAPAAESLDALLSEAGPGHFDAAFIDADKEGYPLYWEKCLELLRDGGLIMVDNTLFSGLVTPEWDDEALNRRWAGRPEDRRQGMMSSVKSIRAFNEKVGQDPRVSLALLPFGDGLTVAYKRPAAVA